MLNHMKADLLRILARPAYLVWCVVFVVFYALMIAGLSAQVSPEELTFSFSTGIQLAFYLVALVITEHTFREDMQFGMFKNYTAGGVSRTRIYLSKFLTGALLLLSTLILCAGACVLAVNLGVGTGGLALMQGLLTPLFLIRIIDVFMNLALFQAASVLIRKTSTLILVCVLFGMAFDGLLALGAWAFPALHGTLAIINPFLDESAQPVTISALAIAVPLACTAALVAAGAVLFARKDL